MDISCCMIVKNEEKVLDTTLHAINGLFNEIVIVDTGSTDKTVDVAKRFTDQIYDFPWIGDFSAAKNYSMEKARNEFVFILDADEQLVKYDKRQMDSLELGNKEIIRIRRRNTLDNGQIYLERIKRVFHRQAYHYEGIIHEQVMPIEGVAGKIIDMDITLDHIGYMGEVLKRTQKIDRNIELLLKAVEKEEQDPYLHFQLGKSYSLNKELARARESFEKAVLLVDNLNLEYVLDLIISYGYTLIHLQQYAGALEMERYLGNFKNQVDYLFLMGLIYMNNGLLEKAVAFFKRCINASEGYIEGINSFMPCYNIGIIYECLGYKEEALQWYKHCESYPLAKERIIALGIKK